MASLPTLEKETGLSATSSRKDNNARTMFGLPPRSAAYLVPANRENQRSGCPPSNFKNVSRSRISCRTHTSSSNTTESNNASRFAETNNPKITPLLAQYRRHNRYSATKEDVARGTTHKEKTRRSSADTDLNWREKSTVSISKEEENSAGGVRNSSCFNWRAGPRILTPTKGIHCPSEEGSLEARPGIYRTSNKHEVNDLSFVHPMSVQKLHRMGANASESQDSDIIQGNHGQSDKIYEEETLRRWLKVDHDRVVDYIVRGKRIFKDSLLASANNPPYFILILKVITRALDSTATEDKVLQLLAALRQILFFDRVVVPTLTMMRSDQHMEEGVMADTVTHVLSVINNVLIRSPTSVITVIGLHPVLKQIVDELKQVGYPCIDELASHMTNVSELIKIKSSKKEQVLHCARRFEEADPPDSFRTIVLTPALQEVRTTDRPILSANITKGTYNDSEHYLDVQFRLLREDFIAPLREGITQYRKHHKDSKERRKLQDLRPYQNVQILDSYCSQDGVLHILRFDTSHLKNIQWEHSKRLMYGSLLCLSPDKFDTILFATVAERDPANLQNGIIGVDFVHELKIVDEWKLKELTMVESVAFFESYRHVLAGLQRIQKLPFEKYIAHCSTDVEVPQYLRKSDQKYDIQPLVDTNYIIQEKPTRLLKETGTNTESKENSVVFDTDEKENNDTKTSKSQQSAVRMMIKVTDRAAWVSPEAIHLDASQYRAIQRALSREFVVLQGPPGTGKTYIGLKIVKTLLHNRNTWCQQSKSPMLIVCYTNHALDQFLEGIVEFYKGAVVRIGGRSKSTKLLDYKFDVVKRKFRSEKGLPQDLRHRLGQALETVKNMKENIEKMKESVASKRNDMNIFGEDVLEPYMGDMYSKLQNGFFDILISHQRLRERVLGSGLQGKLIEEWLGCGHFTSVGDTGLYQMSSSRADLVAENDGEKKKTDLKDIGNNELELISVSDIADKMQDERMIEDTDDLSDLKESTSIQKRTNHVSEVHAQGDKDDTVEINRFRKDDRVQSENQTQHTTEEATDGNPDGSEDNERGDDKEGEWEITKEERHSRRGLIRKMLNSTNTITTEDEIDRIQDIWNMDFKRKLSLYRMWHFKYLEQVKLKLSDVEETYQDCVRELKEAKAAQEEYILQNVDVIGMTTTGAARCQSILQNVGPKIVVVEEAAEVLEGHIVTALSPSCEHLILIGDHQQLRPSPTVYNLAKNYNLDVSLFERMLKNKMPYNCLELQHRMRPEISRIMRHIYPGLKDHVSVTKYENVRGVSTNVFFINHSHMEMDDSDQTSHANEHEAYYLVALCRYLLQQGYDPSQITVLTTYSAQLFCLRKLMPKTTFDGVKVTVVDNFQGEENDIILLSLVRSNLEGNVGFMKIDNRVCVALSRAKAGLYVIGNFDVLSRNSDLWANIVKSLTEFKQIGNALTLFCQNHKDTRFKAEVAGDFQQAPDGGCSKPCAFELQCGHLCEKFCHFDDLKHENYTCKQACKNMCSKGHNCKGTCHKKCPPCLEIVEKTIPMCGHEQRMKCSENENKFVCTKPCGIMLECGHKCRNMCGEEHACDEFVTEAQTCGHDLPVPCGRFTKRPLCKKPCKYILQCGHTCTKLCHEEHTKNCSALTIKTLLCRHKINIPCNKSPDEQVCKELCDEVLQCGHSITYNCSEKSSRRCNSMIRIDFPCGHTSQVACSDKLSAECTEKIMVPSTCGHSVSLSCHENLKNAKCEAKCDTVFSCGHRCFGNCRKCYGGKLHVQCKKTRLDPICDHRSTDPCSTCMPCQLPCQNVCPHAECSKKCCEPCTVCTADCLWACPHFVCSKSCSDICDRPPCNESCPYRCSNCRKSPCIGLCGEKCPDVCIKCDSKGKIAKAAFMRPYDQRMRFLQLDCGHIVYVAFMDYWIENASRLSKDRVPKCPACPQCGHSLQLVNRYQKYIKKAKIAKEFVKLEIARDIREDPNLCRYRFSAMVLKLSEKLTKNMTSMHRRDYNNAKLAVTDFKQWLNRNKGPMTPQERQDAKSELRRLDMMMKLYVYKRKAEKLQNLPDELIQLVKVAHEMFRKECLQEKDWDILETCFKAIHEVFPGGEWEDIPNVKVENVCPDRYASRNWNRCSEGHVTWNADLKKTGRCPRCLASKGGVPL